MKIISRTRWGARYGRGFGPAPLPAAEVWLHHSVTIAPDLVWVDADGDGVEDDEERAMRALEQIGQQRFGGGGISYTFAVMPSGRIYEGHGVDRQGAHTGGRNSIARAIVLVGDYSTRAPTAEQQRAVAWLLQHGQTSGWWRAARLNGGHRQAPGASTECPGDQAQAAIPTIHQLAAGGPIQEDDMPTAKEVADAVWAMPGWHPDRAGGIRMYEQVAWTNKYANLLPGLVAAVAAIASDRDITPEQLEAAVDKAVAVHTPTAEQTAAALLPLVEDIATRVLGADNSAQAAAIVAELGRELTEGQAA